MESIGGTLHVLGGRGLLLLQFCSSSCCCCCRNLRATFVVLFTMTVCVLPSTIAPTTESTRCSTKHAPVQTRGESAKHWSTSFRAQATSGHEPTSSAQRENNPSKTVPSALLLLQTEIAISQ